MALKSLLLIPAALLVGCASMSEQECRTANWEEVGYSDAAGGYESSRIGSHREACAPVGVSVNLAAYRRGYDMGLDSYCTDVTGFGAGESGFDRAGQCDPARFAGYIEAYQQGRTVYQLNSDRENLLARVADANEQVDDLIAGIAKNESALGAEGISKDERRKLQRSIDKLKASLKDTYAEIEELEQRAAELQSEANAVRARFLRI